MKNKRLLSLFLLLSLTLCFLGITGCSFYKPLSRGSLVNAKIAVVYDIDWYTFGGIITSAVVGDMLKDLMKKNFKMVSSKMVESIKENIPLIAPEIVVDENAIFYSKTLDPSNKKEQIFKKLLNQGYTHVLTVDVNFGYNHAVSGTDYARLDYVSNIINLKTHGELYDYKIFPKFYFETKNEENYSLKEQILSEKENSPRLYLKTIIAGFKYLNQKMFKSLKNGEKPVVQSKYNCEKFLRKMGMYSTI